MRWSGYIIDQYLHNVPVPTIVENASLPFITKAYVIKAICSYNGLYYTRPKRERNKQLAKTFVPGSNVEKLHTEVEKMGKDVFIARYKQNAAQLARELNVSVKTVYRYYWGHIEAERRHRYLQGHTSYFTKLRKEKRAPLKTSSNVKAKRKKILNLW